MPCQYAPPSGGVKSCLKKKCPDLGKQEWPPGSGRFRKVCTLAGDRIPGNIVCPKEKK